jgi:hypothetical protein
MPGTLLAYSHADLELLTTQSHAVDVEQEWPTLPRPFRSRPPYHRFGYWLQDVDRACCASASAHTVMHLRSRTPISGICAGALVASASAVAATVSSRTERLTRRPNTETQAEGKKTVADTVGGATMALTSLGKRSPCEQTDAISNRPGSSVTNASSEPLGGEAEAPASPIPPVNGWPRWSINLGRLYSNLYRRDRHKRESRW